MIKIDDKIVEVSVQTTLTTRYNIDEISHQIDWHLQEIQRLQQLLSDASAVGVRPKMEAIDEQG